MNVNIVLNVLIISTPAILWYLFLIDELLYIDNKYIRCIGCIIIVLLTGYACLKGV